MVVSSHILHEISETCDRLLVINRGFVPESAKDTGSRAAGQTAGMLELTGVLRWPEARGLFTPADAPDRNLWFVKDQTAIAAAKGWGAVAPFHVEQEAPPPPGGLPRVARLTVNLPNNHLQYALTWYGLAAALAGIFGTWLWRRRSG